MMCVRLGRVLVMPACFFSSLGLGEIIRLGSVYPVFVGPRLADCDRFFHAGMFSSVMSIQAPLCLVFRVAFDGTVCGIVRVVFLFPCGERSEWHVLPSVFPMARLVFGRQV